MVSSQVPALNSGSFFAPCHICHKMYRADLTRIPEDDVDLYYSTFDCLKRYFLYGNHNASSSTSLTCFSRLDVTFAICWAVNIKNQPSNLLLLFVLVLLLLRPQELGPRGLCKYLPDEEVWRGYCLRLKDKLEGGCRSVVYNLYLMKHTTMRAVRGINRRRVSIFVLV